MIEKSQNFFNENISGVMGLARPRKFALAPDEKTDKSKLIMEAIENTSVFTLSFDSLREPAAFEDLDLIEGPATDAEVTDADTVSDTGAEPEPELVAFTEADTEDTEDDLPSVKVNKDFFWSTQTTGVRFGNDSKDSFSFPYDEYYKTGGVDGVYTILDTAASSLYIS